jgi:hypothetical protein
MKVSRILFSLVIVCGLMSTAWADVLILKNGRAISGTFQGGDPGGISFLVNGQYQRHELKDIQSITIVPTPTGSSSSSSAPAPSYSSGSTSLSSGQAPPSSGGTWTTQPATSSAASSAQQPSMGVTLGSGTIITVRMLDTVDSSVHETGQTFRATLDEPLSVGGRVVAQRGAPVTTKLVAVQEAGRISGRSELALVLYDITVDGRKYEVTSEQVAQAGGSRGAQSATRIGGLAAVGAVIGAIASGGKGAAQGAAAGAGAGTAIQVMTKGEKVQIPAESRLEFTLSTPLYL